MVSIIIPIYNIAPYLNRCIESICNQSFKDLEIILVDDGSTDGGSVVCDNFAMRDGRIIVIHQQNRGLSAARNAGIDIAKGEYLVFVDGDDWIHPDYVKTLLMELEKSNAQMAICGMEKCYDNVEYKEMMKEVAVVSGIEAIPRMLKGEWISACAKMYHHSLFESVRFPIGRNNEDYAILIYLFEKCNKVCLVFDVLYYYFVREGSITHTALNVHSFDEVINGKEIWDYCRKKYPQWSDLALFNLTASIIKLSNQCAIERKFQDKYNEMRAYVLTNKTVMLKNPKLKWKYKPFLWAMMAGKPMHKWLMSLYNKL